MVWSLENMWWWRFLSIVSDCWWMMITSTASRCSMVHVILSNHKIIKPIGQSLQLYNATALCTHWPFQSSILLICVLLTLNGFYKTLFLSVEHVNCAFMSIKWMLFFFKDIILIFFSCYHYIKDWDAQLLKSKTTMKVHLFKPSNKQSFGIYLVNVNMNIKGIVNPKINIC